jgi:hypothetical protein
MFLSVVVLCFVVIAFEQFRYGKECGISDTIDYLEREGIIKIEHNA